MSSKKELKVPALSTKMMEVKIVGKSPLCMHKFPEETVKELLDKKMKVPKAAGKKEYNIEKIAENCIYRLPSGEIGIPLRMIYKSMINAATEIDGLNKTTLRRAIRFYSEDGVEMAKLNFTPYSKDQLYYIDIRPEVISKTIDTRIRPIFYDWSFKITICFNNRIVNEEIILNLLKIAGFENGIGDMRPNLRQGYRFGMFDIEDVIISD